MTLLLPKATRAPFRGAFIHQVANDAMEPLYRTGQHAVVCLPVPRFYRDGIYLIGREELYRCERRGRSVHLWRDNAFYQEYDISIDRFNRAEIAFVVADVAIHDNCALWYMRNNIAA